MKQLFRADRVITGRGEVIEHAAVLVENGLILAVAGQADLAEPDGAGIVDAPRGATLMPGLIDAHVHLAFSGGPASGSLLPERLDLSYPAIALRAAANAQASLVHGFTALRDMHAPGGTIIDLRDAMARGEILGPRISACGRGLTVTGGHMDPSGVADHVSFDNATLPCDGPDAFLRAVRTEARRGADFIKLNTAVGSRKVPGIYWRPEMRPDEIRAACDEAHAQGLYVASHTSGGPPLTATVANGVDCVEHAHWIDDDCIELMAERGTFLVPTLLVNERNFEVTLKPGQLHSDWALASRDAKWVSLEKARKAGIRIGAGTDAGFMIPHGTMHWRELALLVQGGFSPLEAIEAATRVNADLMSLNTGIIETGRIADFVLVDGDPLADLGVLADPERLTVYMNGIEVARAGQLSWRPPIMAPY